MDEKSTCMRMIVAKYEDKIRKKILRKRNMEKNVLKRKEWLRLKEGEESTLIFIKLKSCSCSEWKGRLQQRDRG